jgi:hypothetical protein
LSTFGTGDFGVNNCAWSGVNSFWTNWNSSTFATGTLGRITALAVRWDGSNNAPCLTCTGRNDLWDTGTNLVLNTGTYGVVCTAICNGGVGQGTMHNAGTGNLWQSNASYYIGFWRPASQCTHLGFANNANGGYAGKSADDGNNGGGTAAWGGLGNGGLPVYGTVTDTNIYVRRAGAWVKTFVYVRRAGVWSGPVFVYVRRAGAWTLLNHLGKQEFEIGPNGVEGIAEWADGNRERAWLVEEGQKSWFGSTDPELQDFDWREEGHFPWQDQGWTGKYSSHDDEELAYSRLAAQFNYYKALKDDNPGGAELWYKLFNDPSLLVIHKKQEYVSIGATEKPVFDDPEPILVPCGCS